MSEIVQVRGLTRDFKLGRAAGHAVLRAVDDVNFDIGRGETLGLVGESGSGKSTIGRMMIGLLAPSQGDIRLFGASITGADGKRNLARVRQRLQFVFQDPYSSLNPRMRVGDAVAEPIDIARRLGARERQERIAELFEMVGLPPSFATRFPHEFSGGQRQRIVIARALALNPEFVVCDEAVASLDVSMQAQIVNLLMDLQDKLGLSYLFIAHDLAVVRAISQRVAVLYAGEVVEVGAREGLYARPRHPYTQALLKAVPRPEVGRHREPPIKGELLSVLNRPAGCSLSPRCPHATERCREEKPLLREVETGWMVACHHHETIDARG
ncbi:ABC transporter ATP-binding protein [Bordetella hinzii]|uniref:ABC transporter ATP-binding protein n=1 Tax=Bordetella hinzii TaxID=103855 RepID=A0AAN1VHD8_9BORD|nr:oligopeptide/dipeptide ABC transporter ATP-binding protein [Bordetella hinzii]AKQ55842.1 Oligopeptide transport ATP-binding protein OppF [Bordetella hinzii]AKQ60374.1 Oligopeptide transport ATP-binding protein OppF [Bordetella hinzii]AZW18567.1 ABC transporter ATP-binding protein [Bordetella hinzii]KCB25176.1 oligopeptide/dipeptide transporter, C-terminal domain protein [Bordetella hinzii L60]KCB46003.1 oligopeptide/dipeptide transporter, C-terminal domain protein [Bordetella hinzii 4161]